MKIKLSVAFIVALPVIVLDQLTKLWIESSLAGSDSIVILENFFHIRHIRNTAGAFGSFSWMSMSVFIGLTIAAIGLIGYLYVKLKPGQYAPMVGLALIVGGAVGNLIDRVRLGSVIDFIDVHYYTHHWPAFNVADSAITVGTIILAVCIILKKW
jgi:signal peptidase II